MPEKINSPSIENEDLSVAESQSLDVDEQKKNDILAVIKSCTSLQDTIEQLKRKNLVWHFIDLSCKKKDEDITGQANLKWKEEFGKSINEAHKKFEAFLPDQSFLAYSTKDNDFNIRFENEEKPIKISNILRTSNEGKNYNISLGENSQVTACKKNGNERHYDFTGSGSCEMTVNWQAKDPEGNSTSCSMTVKVGLNGILEIIGEPKFGDLKFTDSLSEEEGNKVLEPV